MSIACDVTKFQQRATLGCPRVLKSVKSKKKKDFEHFKTFKSVTKCLKGYFTRYTILYSF